MLALVKTQAGPGLELTEVPEPAAGINDVLIRVRKAGICGTDLHIACVGRLGRSDDPAAAGRRPRVRGRDRRGGQQRQRLPCRGPRQRRGPRRLRPLPPLPGRSPPPLRPQHRPGRRPRRRLRRVRGPPMTNVWHHWPGIDEDVAAIFDPFGNAVHTALRFPVLGEDVLVSGAGPIGLMSIAVVRHAGARHRGRQRAQRLPACARDAHGGQPRRRPDDATCSTCSGSWAWSRASTWPSRCPATQPRIRIGHRQHGSRRRRSRSWASPREP